MPCALPRWSWAALLAGLACSEAASAEWSPGDVPETPASNQVPVLESEAAAPESGMGIPDSNEAGGGKRTDRAGDDGRDGERQQPGLKDIRRERRALEGDAADAQDAVDADLGHDREQRGDRRGGGAVDARQPERERQERRLEGEDCE